MNENEIKNSMKWSIESVLGERHYPFSNHAITKIVDTWYEKKMDLINILSKHPKWKEDKMMIQFDQDYSRKTDWNVIRRFAQWAEKSITPIDRHKGQMMWCFIRNVCEEFLSPDYDGQIKELNDLNPNYKLRNNMKTSKAVGKIFREEGWDKIFKDYNREYAAYCDAISPIKVTRHTCISLNPVDFLLMSNGNSWDSCHYIDDFYDEPGCYSSGTISYMLDDVSFVFYTVDANFNGSDIEIEPKICRQIFAYQDGQLLQSRLYPQNNDSGAEHIYSEIRAIIQKVIAECLDEPNLWKKVGNIDSLRHVVFLEDGATCYPDWEYFSTVTLSTLNAIVGDQPLKEMPIGAEPICIECGCGHEEDYITCCSTPGRVRCSNCGNAIDGDDVIWINDEPYCSNCVFWCQHCESYHLSRERNTVYVQWRFGTEVEEWCDDCVDNYATQCDDCGSLWSNDDIESVEGYSYCPECIEDNTFICDECGECYLNSSKNEFEDKMLCDCCFKDAVEESETEEDDENAQEVA